MSKLGLIHNITLFDDDDFSLYIEQLEQYFVANDADNSKKVSVLLSVIGEKVYFRRLALTCSFGAFLDEALRDRFVCGLNDENMQKRLLAKKDLKLSDATEIAVATEIANADASNMKIFSPVVNKMLSQSGNRGQKKVNFSNNASSKESKSKCFSCGAVHNPRNCKYKRAKYHSCGKIGHISPVCLSKK
nr:uncharacterized protein LOC122272296 [Parasteatoda tepidariorum]